MLIYLKRLIINKVNRHFCHVSRKFRRTLMRFENRFNPWIGIIDFNYFDEKRLKDARRGKQKGEQIQNFQYARSQRYLERVCQQYVELKTLFGIEKSIFLFEENFLTVSYTHLTLPTKRIV